MIQAARSALLLLIPPALVFGCAQIIGADFDHPLADTTGSGGASTQATGSGGAGGSSTTGGGGSGGCTSDHACPDPGACLVRHCDLPSGTCTPKEADDGTGCTTPTIVSGTCSSGICGGPCKTVQQCTPQDCHTVACSKQVCVYTDDATAKGVECTGTQAGQYCNGEGMCVPRCQDEKQDGNEVGLDCGGGCPGCSDGTMCTSGKDCDSGYCATICGPWAVGISVSNFGACARTNAGRVKCWGYGIDGQLGDGNSSTSASPVGVANITSGTQAIAAGTSNSCAVDMNGALLCWGRNQNGEIDGMVATRRPTPVLAHGLSSGIAFGAIGNDTGCALTTGGAVKCWCDLALGACGNGAIAPSSTPVVVTGLGSGVAQIAAGNSFNCARTNAGTVKCWGSNLHGQLGDGTYDHAGGCTNADCSATPVTVKDLTDVVSLAAGNGSADFACAATMSGSVFCWGDNQGYQLGDNNTPHDDCGGYDCSATPVQVVNIQDATMVALGDQFACALTSAGAVKCWGNNDSGSLGDGTMISRNTPVDVVGLGSGVVEIAAGGFTACARTMPSGGVKCWGYGADGELGNGMLGQDSSKPVTVVLP